MFESQRTPGFSVTSGGSKRDSNGFWVEAISFRPGTKGNLSHRRARINKIGAMQGRGARGSFGSVIDTFDDKALNSPAPRGILHPANPGGDRCVHNSARRSG